VKLKISLLIGIAAAATDLCAQSVKPSTATGLLHLTFAERSPLSAMEVVLKRLEMTSLPADAQAAFGYDLSRETFDVFVPPDYKPNSPCGLFIWTGVSEFGSGWLEVLSRHKFIAASANTSEGHTALYGKPLDLVYNLKKAYTIDEGRIYISGFSAGGGVAAHLLRGYPEVFRGGLLLMGGYFYLSRQGADGRRDPTVEEELPHWKGPLEQIKKEVKLVIMKGGKDPWWTPQEGRSDYQALWLDGFRHVTYLEIPGQDHRPPDSSWFEKGVAALDHSQVLEPPLTSPTKDAKPLEGQQLQAKRLLMTAQYHLEVQPPKRTKEIEERIRKSEREKARKYLQQVIDEFPTTPSATKARELMSKSDEHLAEPRVLPGTK
jgi:predicted esterase